MKKNILFAIIGILASCAVSKQPKTHLEVRCTDDHFVAGHFYDKHSVDTLFVRLMDEKMKYCIPQMLDTVDWERNLSLIVKRESRLLLKGNKETLIVADHPQIPGFLQLENLGDLDGDGLDEIGFIFDAQDFSSLSTYHVYSLEGKKLKEWFGFPIHESFLEDEKPNFIYIEGDSIFCREYHPEYDNLTDDGEEYYARSRKK